MAKKTIIIFTGMALFCDLQGSPPSQAWLEAAQAAGFVTCIISNEPQPLLDARVKLFPAGLIAATIGGAKFDHEDVFTALAIAGVDLEDCGHILLVGRGVSSFKLTQNWNGRQFIASRSRLETARQQNEAGMTCVYLGPDPTLRDRVLETGHYALDSEAVLAFLQGLKGVSNAV